MDDVRTTNEKLRAIERWENEGGRVLRAGNGMPASRREIIRNEELASAEVIRPRKKRRRDVDLCTSWRWA